MKYLFRVVVFLCFFVWIVSMSFAAPEINCGNLPGCGDQEISGEWAGVYTFIANVIATMIQYIAVIAVLAIMIGGIMYLISSGEEEKTKRAKNIIVWALVGVFLSIIAWTLIAILNNFMV